MLGGVDAVVDAYRAALAGFHWTAGGAGHDPIAPL